MGKTVKDTVTGKTEEQEEVAEETAEETTEQVVVDDSAAQELVTELETKKPAAVKNNPKFRQVLSKIANKIVGGQDTLTESEQKIQDEFADELDVEITKVQESKKKVETETLSDEAYNKFVDTGEVSQGVIADIAQKIKAGKKLTKEEESVRQAKSKEVENLLKEESKTEAKEDDNNLEPKSETKTDPKKAKVKPKQETKRKRRRTDK